MLRELVPARPVRRTTSRPSTSAVTGVQLLCRWLSLRYNQPPIARANSPIDPMAQPSATSTPDHLISWVMKHRPHRAILSKVHGQSSPFRSYWRMRRSRSCSTEDHDAVREAVGHWEPHDKLLPFAIEW